MGSAFVFSAVHPDKDSALLAIDAGIDEVIRIEKMISSWDPNSATSKLNNAQGRTTEIPEELYQLIQRAKMVSKLTEGRFDISFEGMHGIWKFDGRTMEWPNDSVIEAHLSTVDHSAIILREMNGKFLARLDIPGMKIGFGSIGKGYAADKAAKVMRSMGIESGVVNASGDLLAWGSKPDGSPWKVGISDPSERNRVLLKLEANNNAIVTSGDYERYVIIDGERYGHILDAKTGKPVKHAKSVTIIYPIAELADAMATAVFILGPIKGIELVEKMDGMECIIVDNNNQLVTSSGIELDHEATNE